MLITIKLVEIYRILTAETDDTMELERSHIDRDSPMLNKMQPSDTCVRGKPMPSVFVVAPTCIMVDNKKEIGRPRQSHRNLVASRCVESTDRG